MSGEYETLSMTLSDPFISQSANGEQLENSIYNQSQINNHRPTQSSVSAKYDEVII